MLIAVSAGGEKQLGTQPPSMNTAKSKLVRWFVRVVGVRRRGMFSCGLNAVTEPYAYWPINQNDRRKRVEVPSAAQDVGGFTPMVAGSIGGPHLSAAVDGKIHRTRSGKRRTVVSSTASPTNTSFCTADASRRRAFSYRGAPLMAAAKPNQEPLRRATLIEITKSDERNLTRPDYTVGKPRKRPVHSAAPSLP